MFGYYRLWRHPPLDRPPDSLSGWRRLSYSESVIRSVLMILASARVTRFLTTDWLGEWLVVQPLKKAVDWDDSVDMHYGTPAQKAVTGLDCPHCVSFWSTLLVLALASLPLQGFLGKARDILIGSLAGSYVVGHLSETLDK